MQHILASNFSLLYVFVWNLCLKHFFMRNVFRLNWHLVVGGGINEDVTVVYLGTLIFSSS